MKNAYEVSSGWAKIALFRKGKKHVCVVDAADIAKLLTLPVTWYPNPARKSTTKFYAQAKVGNSTVLMHRFLMDAPKHSEVHHVDNNGLNNCRSSNLRFLDHQGNMRERWPTRDWTAYDATTSLGSQYRKERSIAAAVQLEFKIGRQALWKIRRQSVPGRSPASQKYHTMITEAGIMTLGAMQAAHPRDGKWGASVNSS